MNTVLIIVNIVVFLIFIFALYQMQKKHVSFSKRVFTGLGIGLVFGFIIHLIYGTDSEITTGTIDWLNIVGSGYVKLLQMVVMPLVFISIVGAFTKLKITKNLGKISALVIGILLLTTGISAGLESDQRSDLISMNLRSLKGKLKQLVMPHWSIVWIPLRI